MEALQADLHIAEVDATYTQYFPHMERYVSLYPVQGKDEKGSAEQSAAARALHAPRPEMWSVVEQAMQGGEKALVRLRERMPESLGKPAPSKMGPLREVESGSRESVRTKGAQTLRAKKDKGRQPETREGNLRREREEGADDDSDSDFLEDVPGGSAS